MLNLASDYFDSIKDENGNVPVILNKGANGLPSKERYTLLNLSAEFVKWLYVTNGTGVYCTRAYKKIAGKEVFGAVEIFAEHFDNQRI